MTNPLTGNWYEPTKTSEFLRRILSFSNLLILCTAAAFIISELRFDWCELMIGRYLASLNSSRPETGAVWKAGEQSSRAHTFLKNIIEERQNAARYAQEATSFAELASGILPGQWANIDKEHFKRLYLSIPLPAASELITPSELIWLFNGGVVTRIFCEGKPYGLEIFFLNSANRALRQITLNSSKMEKIEKNESVFKGTLDQIPEFKGRIYHAERFFKVLLELSQDIVPDLITTPQKLINQQGTLTRAGIWNEAASGYIKLGFEFKDNNGKSVVLFIRAREWAVWHLSSNLTGN
ncbi:MAG: hypothetical protein HQK73_04265 [Desulfamplus sp.]|nr:hypothetical protein [Desulfamplus sp.]MBF0411822.1 hypothetical protein [Desulfamplus sp.]